MKSSIMHLGQEINCASYLIKQAFNEVFSDARFSGIDARLLFMISEHPDFTPSDIAKKIGLRRATITEQIHYLTDNGYITYSVSSSDRRKKTMALTDKGLSTIKSAMASITEFEEDLEKMFTKQEIDMIHSVYTKIKNKFTCSKSCPKQRSN